MIYKTKQAEEIIENLKKNKEGSLINETEILILGVGKGGCNSAFEFKDICTTGYLNTSSDDLKQFVEYNKKLCLKFGNAEGAGKISELSKQMAINEKNKINPFIDSLKTNPKIVFIIYSVGGGTGLGSAMTIAENYESYYKEKYNKNVNVILVALNPTKNEMGIVSENEFKHAKNILNKASKVPFMIIDNNYIITDENSKNYELVNKNIALSFLRLFEKNESYNNDRTDGTDIILSFRQAGYIYINTFNIEKDIPIDEQIIKNIKKDSVFFKPDLKTVKRINYVINSSPEFIQQFKEESLRKLAENGNAVTITSQLYKSDENTFTIAFFGCSIDKSFIDNAHKKYIEYTEHNKIENNIKLEEYQIDEEEKETDIDDLVKYFDL